MSSTKIPSNCVLREVRQGSWCGSGRHVHKQHVCPGDPRQEDEGCPQRPHFPPCPSAC